MASAHPDVLKASGQLIMDNANCLCLCQTEPTSRAEAYTTHCLAKKAITSTDFAWTSVPEGERLLLTEQSNVPIEGNGTLNFWALVDDNRLLATNAMDPMPVITGGGNQLNTPVLPITGRCGT